MKARFKYLCSVYKFLSTFWETRYNFFSIKVKIFDSGFTNSFSSLSRYPFTDAGPSNLQLPVTSQYSIMNCWINSVCPSTIVIRPPGRKKLIVSAELERDLRNMLTLHHRKYPFEIRLEKKKKKKEMLVSENAHMPKTPSKEKVGRNNL